MADKLDLLLQRMDDHIAQSAEHRDETRAWRDKVEETLEKTDKRLDKTEEQLFLYKSIIRVVKWFGGLLLLLVTLKFGDIGKYLFHN